MAEKEALTAQRDVLERRKLRSSQATARDIVNLSLQIDSIESALSVKMKGQLYAPKQTMRHRLLSGCGISTTLCTVSLIHVVNTNYIHRTTCQWVWLTPTIYLHICEKQL